MKPGARLSLLIACAAVLAVTSFAHADYPATPFEPSDNVQDPGNIPSEFGGGSCGPLDANCYVSLPATVTPNLQQVTNAGNTTTNSILVVTTGDSERVMGIRNSDTVFVPSYGVDMPIMGAELGTSTKYGTTFPAGLLSLGDGHGLVAEIVSLPLTEYRALYLPDADGTFAISVNGVGADSAGNIALPLAVSITGTSSDTIYSAGLSGTGVGDLDAGNNIFLGVNAGNGATNAAYSLFLGNAAGQGGTDTSYAIFFGDHAGYGAVNSNSANFIGTYAGYQASYAVGSNFIGQNAGYQATYAEGSNFIGPSAGYGATNAAQANFFGNNAGYGAENATYSNFMGTQAGQAAENADHSDFIGYYAGYNAVNAPNSIFIGSSAGSGDGVDNTASNTGDSCDDPYLCYSILLGPQTSTGTFSNSIAMGAYATNTAANQIMIGSSTRRIEEMVFNGGAGNTCSIVAGTGISCSSDKRLKTNIEDLSSSTLDDLLQLRTVTYNWKSDPRGDTMIGFIAQNLQQYFPELVSRNADGMLAVNYAGMTPILTKAIQEMNLNITDLTNLGRENTWRDSLIEWFADARNGIGDFVAERIHADRADLRELCLDDVCVTKDELRALLDGAAEASSHDDSDDDAQGDESEETVDNTADDNTPAETEETEEPATPTEEENETDDTGDTTEDSVPEDTSAVEGQAADDTVDISL